MVVATGGPPVAPGAATGGPMVVATGGPPVAPGAATGVPPRAPGAAPGGPPVATTQGHLTCSAGAQGPRLPGVVDPVPGHAGRLQGLFRGLAFHVLLGLEPFHQLGEPGRPDAV